MNSLVIVRLLVISLVTWLPMADSAIAQQSSIAAIGYRTPYKFAKPAIESSFRPGSSLEQRKNAVLKAAEVAYGSRAHSALGPSVDVLAKTPGGMKVARELAIMNPSNRKGALRAARVAGAFDTDGRFKVVALEQLVRSQTGAVITDRDIVVRHRTSGARGRIEVKDATARSQQSNLAKYKRQINLMAMEQRQTGQLQAFINRRELIPELQRYAEKKKVAAYGNVVTSSDSNKAAGTTPISKVLDDLDRKSRATAQVRTSLIGLGVAASVLEGRRAVTAWHRYADGTGSWSDASFHSLVAFSGGSFAIAGIASTLATQTDPSARLSKVLGRVGRFGGPVGGVLAAGAVGIRTYQWHSGEMNTSQFVTASVSAGGGLAGGLAGAGAGGLAGAKLGIVIAPFAGPAAPFTPAVGYFLGALGGGIAGAWAGNAISSHAIESYYSRLDTRQQERLFASLRLHYQNGSQ